MSAQQTAQKFVHITQVIRFDEDVTTLTYPNLMSICGRARHYDLDNISLRPVKRTRFISDEQVQISIDMFGNADNTEMVATRAHHELNYDYFVGIRDKNTGNTKLVEIDSLYALRPALPDDIKTIKEYKEDDKKEMSYTEKRTELLQSFGGKKSVQRLRKYQRDRITEEKVERRMAETITNAAEAMRERDSRQGISLTVHETTESLAPPHDNTATDPLHAYPLVRLLSAPEILALEQEAKAVIEFSKDPKTSGNPGWYPLVWDVMQNVISNDDSEELKLQRIQALIQLHYLLVLAHSPAKITSEVQNTFFEQMAVEDEVLQCLLERFTSPTDRKFVRTKSKLDSNRIITHAVIMWLTALGFNNCMRLGELSAALKINISVLLRVATNLGCKIRKQKDQSGPNKFSITLKVPLKFPRLKKKYQRK
eukprot:TRINITY_DN77_c0_g1_i1.p3 TRINITY_DN77_c0_g1~~TRINITY_DN77_c0_g1_i1.p3  ORF type:complete len:424 (-),score=63.29 TRINITY_DN77_c0_g1_i1:7278-8549(-)